MTAKIKERDEANIPEGGKEFAGKTQMPKVLRRE
jgi:hypothetical protein